MAKKTPTPAPSTQEVLQQLSILGGRIFPSSVRFLEADKAVRDAVMDHLVAQGAHRMRDLYTVDGISLDPSHPMERYQLHSMFSERAKRAPFVMVVDYEGWDPEAVESLFSFLSWVAHGDDARGWSRLTLLAMGQRLPWFVQNVEQQSYGITLRV